MAESGAGSHPGYSPLVSVRKPARVNTASSCRTSASLAPSREDLARQPIWISPDPAATRAFLASPAGAIVTLLTLTAAFFHMRIGIQEIVEDYIHKGGMKAVLLIGNTLLVLGLWLATVFALVKLAL